MLQQVENTHQDTLYSIDKDTTIKDALLVAARDLENRFNEGGSRESLEPGIRVVNIAASMLNEGFPPYEGFAEATLKSLQNNLDV